LTVDIHDIESRLWSAADELRANSKLKSSEYSIPVLGLIFLRHADHRFTAAKVELEGKGSERRKIGKDDYHDKGVLYLPSEAQFSTLLNLPEGENIGQEINDAMKAIEEENPSLRGVLPKTYNRIENSTLIELLKLLSSIPADIEGDAFGKIYEYFLGHFASAEGSKGGEFYTPTSIVRLIVEIMEPYHGRILDPACGSGGMFVQSARFVGNHSGKNPSEEISIFGQERVAETVRLAKMNLAVHGLDGDIRQGNTYYEDLHNTAGKFDFVMANPPFNVNRVDKEKLKDDPRFPYGLPKPDNANYLWMQVFASALNDTGRAGFVMANSASDARASELEIRRQMIEDGIVDVVVAVSNNFFYTVTLPVTLWFLDKGKRDTDRADKVLFIDARHLYRQIDRAHRDFDDSHIALMAFTADLYREGFTVVPEVGLGLIAEHFGVDAGEDDDMTLEYRDVPGYCRVATIAEIENQGWSLNPGRYVGIAEGHEEDFDFMERLEELSEELAVLNSEADSLQVQISTHLGEILA
jgi:type I restriction enzyme M protein